MQNFYIRLVLSLFVALTACSALALPGTALRFNGTNNSASVGDAPALDAFPMTALRCRPIATPAARVSRWTYTTA